jgi:septal ring factor EnvC (AmiA/AmiB activator)
MGSLSSRTFIGCLIAAAALQQPSAPAQERTPPSASQRAAERIRALQRESDELASQEQTVLVELRKLEIDRELKSEQLAVAERDLAETQRKLADTTSRAAALKTTAETERPMVEAGLVRLYKLGRVGYWKLLLDFDHLQSIGRAYRMAAAMNRLDRERVQQHQRTLEALAHEQRALEGHVKDVARLQQQAASARAAVERALAARTALIKSIDERRDVNARLVGELEAARQRLESQMQQPGAEKAAVNLPLKPFRGALPWPANGVVTGYFGRPRSSRIGTTIARSGIDISIAEGQPVRAIHEGAVVYADQYTGYGPLVIVDHGDGAYSLYGYLSTLEVTRAQHVDASSLLGTSGRNPSGNPALYFELRVDGKPVDPLQWLKH